MIYNLIGKVKGFFNTITIMDMIISLVYILVGIVLLIASSLSIKVLAILMGIILIINAIVSIYSFIKNNDISLFKNNLLFGIVLVIAGIVALFLKAHLNIVLGIYLIAVGAQKINYGMILKEFNESSWLITLVMGIVLIVIAGLTIFTSTDNIIRVTSIYLIGYGIINFTSTLLLRKRSQYFL